MADYSMVDRIDWLIEATRCSAPPTIGADRIFWLARPSGEDTTTRIGIAESLRGIVADDAINTADVIACI